MIGSNGGLIGAARTPSFGKESGLWTPSEHAAYKSSGQWGYDPYGKGGKTILLLHMNGGNGSTTFLDNSTYNTAISASGGVSISTADSKYGGSSAYFNGASGVLTVSNSVLFDLSKDVFTFELWLKPLAFPTSGQYCRLIMFGSNASAASFCPLQFDSTGYVCATIPLGGTSAICGATLTLNTWQHYAVTLNGGQSKMFLNGIQVASGTITQPTSTSNFMRIGFDTAGTVNFNYNGYINDFRITRGVALYTTNFTPPSTLYPNPYLDPYFSQVSLLLRMNGSNGSTTFVDSSLGNLAVTANGNAQISTAQSMFGGSSAAFDGNGDYLTLADSSIWDLPGDFTLEAWIRASSTGFSAIFSTRNTGGAVNPVLYLWDTGVLTWYYNGAARITGTTNIVGGGFYHVAVCRSGNSTRLFVNGVQEGTTYVNSDTYVADGIWIGGLPAASQYLNGYIDDLRITKGVARYTANFTPPGAPFPDA